MAMKVHSAGIHGGQSVQDNVCNVQACDMVDRSRVKLAKEEEEEEFYKFLPANTADRLWQSLSNPAKRHSFVSN